MKKKSTMKVMSNDTSGNIGSRGSLNPSEMTEIVTNPAKMFVYPGKKNSSMIDMMLNQEEKLSEKPFSPPGTGDRSQ
jgi:hypothetical protein